MVRHREFFQYLEQVSATCAHQLAVSVDQPRYILSVPINKDTLDPGSCLITGERERGLTKEPIEVIPADSNSYLAKVSRIRFGETFSIEWRVKVKVIGIVSDDFLSTLLAHHQDKNIQFNGRVKESNIALDQSQLNTEHPLVFAVPSLAILSQTLC